MTKASDVFVAALEIKGIGFVLGVLGEENIDLLDSFSRSRRIRLVLTRHERHGVHGGDLWTPHRDGGGLPCVVEPRGDQSDHARRAYATLGGMPMLMITGQKPVKRSKQGRFQVFDVVETMGSITNHAHQIVSAENIPSCLREAVRLGSSG